MTIKFNVTWDERKRLVKAISEFAGVTAEYQFMPTCAYKIGDITVDKDGTLITDEDIAELLVNLAENGFVSETTNYPTQAAEMPHNEEMGLCVAMPRDYFNDDTLENLKRLIANKEYLIKKALGVNELPIEIDEESVRFPWFAPQGDACAVKAYTHFIQALCEMARSQKRVNTGEKAIESEKYAFCFCQ